MFILASDFFEKYDKYVFKARFFSQNKSDDYLIFVHQKS